MEQREKLAAALEKARSVSDEGIVDSRTLPASVRTLLVKAGFLEKLVRGWYILLPPGSVGDTTSFFSIYWSFLRQYLSHRFGPQGYCLSPMSSLDILTGETTIPAQLVVLTRRPSNVPLDLPHGMSILMYSGPEAFPPEMEAMHGVNIMPLAYALVRVPLAYFRKNPRSIDIALSLLPSPAHVSRELVRHKAVSAAGRIAGAYEHLGNRNAAELIMQDMSTSGFSVRPENPFQAYEPVIGARRMESPYAARILAAWGSLREQVISRFPEPEFNLPVLEQARTIEEIKSLAGEDAYHSLSIEGYRVTDGLIDRIRSGDWFPGTDDNDRSQLDALAARGYGNTFNIIMGDIAAAFNGENTGSIVRRQSHQWYRELFLPMVQAGILQPQDLIGYRRGPVYIRNARHVPPPSTALVDAMDMFFTQLENESNGAVRAILGHYFFVFIHPYMDGNGRVARFLMNLMLVTAGYHWTIIRVSERNRYMSALDLVATHHDIRPFTDFVAAEMDYWRRT